MASLALNNGHVVTLDDDDLQVVQGYSWHVSKIYKRYYAVSKVNGKTVYMHRLITQAPDGMDVDHLNRDGLDNRRINLVIRGRSGNLANAGTFKNNTSGYRGVIHYRNGWRAQTKFKHNGVQRLISSRTFNSPERAAEVRDAIMFVLHGSDIYLNFEDRPISDSDVDLAKSIVSRTLGREMIRRNTR